MCQGSRIGKLERRIDRMTRKFLDCNAKVEDILRCGQTGIKLKRKEGADVGLVSGDESESASPNPSTKDGEDEDDDDVEVDANKGGMRGKDLLFPVTSSFSANFLAADSKCPSTSVSPPLPPSFIGLGNLTRSPIKLRLRQTDVGDDKLGMTNGDDVADDRMPSSDAASRALGGGEDKEEAKISSAKHIDDDADDEAEKAPENNRGKGGKSSSSKRKGKTAGTGSKRKKSDKQAADGEACKKDAAATSTSGASTSSSFTSQRKRQKL